MLDSGRALFWISRVAKRSLKQSSQRASPEKRHENKSPPKAAQRRKETKINQIEKSNHL